MYRNLESNQSWRSSSNDGYQIRTKIDQMELINSPIRHNRQLIHSFVGQQTGVSLNIRRLRFNVIMLIRSRHYADHSRAGLDQLCQASDPRRAQAPDHPIAKPPHKPAAGRTTLALGWVMGCQKGAALALSGACVARF